MSKTIHTLVTKNPGMIFVMNYFVLFFVNILVLMAANAFFPEQIVLGTMTVTYFWAVVHSMGVLALIDTLTIPLITQLEVKQKRTFGPKEWTAAYFIINFVGLWLIARFSEQFGLGISGWYVAAALAIVLDLLQGVAMMQLGKYYQA